MIFSTCQNCGKPISASPYTAKQLFCCEECRVEFHKKNKKITFVPFDFTCARCGRVIHIESIDDKRTRFCCEECEKRYWRHPPYEHETSKTNFHSAQEYLSWERRTNEEE